MNYSAVGCVVRLDRVLLAASGPRVQRNVPRLDGYKVIKDIFVPRQTTVATYARSRELRSPLGTKIYWQYQKQNGWLAPWRITLVPDDRRGLCRAELDAIVARCRWYRLVLVEIAFDFDTTVMSREFVRRHALFGKCRFRNTGADGTRYYGSRKSNKLIRCYLKSTTNGYRIELELHSGFLRAHDILKANQLMKLAVILFPQHIRFVQMNWKSLRWYLIRKFGNKRGRAIFRRARRKRRFIHNVCRFLRRKGIRNVHRFLQPLTLNKTLREALDVWKTKISPDVRWTTLR